MDPTGRTPASHRRLLRLVVPICLIVGTSCSPTVLERVPERLARQAMVDDNRNIRFYADDAEGLRTVGEDRIREIRRTQTGRGLQGRAVDINYLSISGGGADGAFGAGLLNGWTATGTRPKFDVVTGISTGALIAPLAFLGSNYDAMLKEAYTTTSTANIEDSQVMSAFLGLAPSLSSNAAFAKLIARFLTAEMLDAIAVEHRKGRALLIGTTNLDAERPVIWDIGAIAASGRPDALELTQRIIMASATIPGVFPPVRIQVTADGKTYDELHVDGGVTRQVFLLPPGYDPKRVDAALGWKPRRRAFIIRNGKVGAQFDAVETTVLPIANRSIATLIKTQGIGDLYRIYLFARRNGIDYNLAYIPGDFQAVSTTMFDPDYMKALFDHGYEQGARGFRWQKLPPGME